MFISPDVAESPAHLGIPLDDFVEIGLLLPTNRANALLELAHNRGETVGQILRRLVDLALSENRAQA
jgi:hypothetical protein